MCLYSHAGHLQVWVAMLARAPRHGKLTDWKCRTCWVWLNPLFGTMEIGCWPVLASYALSTYPTSRAFLKKTYVKFVAPSLVIFSWKIKRFGHAHRSVFLKASRHEYYVWISNMLFKHQLRHTYWQNHHTPIIKAWMIQRTVALSNLLEM
jgi:hypothetical protein